VALAAAGAFHGAASADDVHCPPAIGRSTVDGNVLVAAPCRLDGTTVKGNVHLYAGGSLVADEVVIIGSIQAENADFVDVADSRVNGDIQLDDLVGDRSRVERTTVGGSIQLKNNRSRLEILGNDVTGDVQAFDNHGGALIADNIIDGNLQCKGNEPPPAGGSNRVSGNEEDQCANLAAEDASGAPAEDSSIGAGTGSGPSAAPVGATGGGGAIDRPVAGLLLTLLVALRLARRTA
jgi:hypothetical protein